MTLLDVEISVNGSWVKYGDQWLVQEVAADGAVTVARTLGAGMPGGRQVVLPADYVRQHWSWSTRRRRTTPRVAPSTWPGISDDGSGPGLFAECLKLDRGRCDGRVTATIARAAKRRNHLAGGLARCC
jgi:hypothetical protein